MDTSFKSKFKVDQSTNQRRPLQRAYTFIELLVAMFVVTVTAVVGKSVASRYGTGLGIPTVYRPIGVAEEEEHTTRRVD